LSVVALQQNTLLPPLPSDLQELTPPNLSSRGDFRFVAQTAVLRAEARIAKTDYELKAEDFKALDELILCVPTLSQYALSVREGSPQRDLRVFRDFVALSDQEQLLGLEAGDDAARVHPELDDLEGHAAANRFLLFGHVDHATAAFAHLLQQLVSADSRAKDFGVVLREIEFDRRTGLRCFRQKGLGSFGGPGVTPSSAPASRRQRHRRLSKKPPVPEPHPVQAPAQRFLFPDS
jgi:hypothetical protein